MNSKAVFVLVVVLAVFLGPESWALVAGGGNVPRQGEKRGTRPVSSEPTQRLCLTHCTMIANGPEQKRFVKKKSDNFAP